MGSALGRTLTIGGVYEILFYPVIYERYVKICGRLDADSVSERRVRDHLSDMNMLGLINLYERNEGLSAGRYHEYELDVPSKRHVLKSSRTSSSRQPTITICFSRISPTIERSFLRG